MDLKMDVFYPKHYKSESSFPSIVIFHGGHWIGGKPTMMHHLAKEFANIGFVAFTPEYRTKNIHGATPFQGLKDAKSSIRYIRAHADQFKINPNQILAAGGSAGGHLAAATACTEKYNQEGEDKTISCIPDGLILYSAVIDNSPEGYGYERIGESYKEFSPFHLNKTNMPPTFIIHGENDDYISCDRMREYCRDLSINGRGCTIKCFENTGHRLNKKIYKSSIRMAMNMFKAKKIINLDIPKTETEK